jgi:hypothetical protein
MAYRLVLARLIQRVKNYYYILLLLLLLLLASIPSLFKFLLLFGLSA